MRQQNYDIVCPGHVLYSIQGSRPETAPARSVISVRQRQHRNYTQSKDVSMNASPATNVNLDTLAARSISMKTALALDVAWKPHQSGELASAFIASAVSVASNTDHVLAVVGGEYKRHHCSNFWLPSEVDSSKGSTSIIIMDSRSSRDRGSSSCSKCGYSAGRWSPL